MPDTTAVFPALVVRGSAEAPQAAVESLSVAELPPGEVLIEVEFSSLNYKDALAYGAHPGVVRSLPHVPGIDCAGKVVECGTDDFQPGDPVLVTGYGLGAASWGGYSRYVRVPAEWVVAMPAGLDARRAMAFGTAGFTAGQAVGAIVDGGVSPDAGEVVVTGATGGVGLFSVAILAKLGYEVAAVTGKSAYHDALRQLGAARILGRDEVADDSDRPLLKSQWAAAVDTVGGRPLTTILRSTNHRGVVAACGLVAGEELPLTVHPFILRGVTLHGVDSAKCPRKPRLEVWRRLAGEWAVELPDSMVNEVSLDGVAAAVEQMLAGKHAGRTLVRPITG